MALFQNADVRWPGIRAGLEVIAEGIATVELWDSKVMGTTCKRQPQNTPERRRRSGFPRPQK